MDAFTKHWLRLYNCLLAGILTILGFYGCTSESPDEYGTPHAAYELKGKVINTNQQPLADVQIVVGQIENNQFLQWDYNRDTLYTNSNGEFIYKNDYVWPRKLWRAKFTALQKNGNISIYKADSVDIDMGEPKGGKGWYAGKASKEITIIVKEKENAE
ncbi:radical SAM-associated putative lipoprotein [Bacteroides sp. 519]|uniref:radical SAM-associated putative lipoprotein n=1 Tax=Bacteroides sp. 519 TaxID=2302937 RepID=UPI0013D55EB5|nr:radical SAM-associated putative lipoprotein [Bacteroides sp. 519]NDV57602.1 hypothetical protein [Bacteroides sp. 519]